jgi:cation diffusion facilitator family transporter
MAEGSKLVVYAALAGNAAIAVTKVVASALTGSSAMLSEAIHSLVDTGNQGLLLYGMKRAARPPDVKHPFGHGMELYFWAFVVAILIFGLGGGLSIYEGIAKIREPHELQDVHVAYIVLGLAILFETFSWLAAVRELGRRKGRLGWLEAVRASKDPSVFTVLLEDTAALIGLLIALVGIWLGQLLGDPRIDGVASVLIGLLLVVTAAFLANETRSLLTGESAGREIDEGIRAIVREERAVRRLNELLTMHLGPDDVLVAMSLDFDDGVSAEQVEAIVSDLEARAKTGFPEVTRVFVEAQSWRVHRERATGVAPA